MSQQLTGYLRGLFGSTDGADCCIRFHVAPEEPHAQGVGACAMGKALPAHKLVLRGGSERFRAHIDRWAAAQSHDVATPAACQERVRVFVFAFQDSSPEHGGGPCVRVRLSIGGGGSTSGSSACSRQGSPSLRPGLSHPALPELAVPLGGEEELEPSLAAMRFMYTGTVGLWPDQQQQQQQQLQGAGEGPARQQGDGRRTADCVDAVPCVAELLRIRRQAEYLQVQGCTEACDEALVQWFRGAAAGGGGYSSSSSSRPESPLAPVLELYRLRHLLPSEEDDHRVGRVLSACRRWLSINISAQLPAGGHSGSGQQRSSRISVHQQQATKVELVMWLLGSGDAVQIANDDAKKQLWCELPEGALAELLRSDKLCTDDEATVVYLVAQWVSARARGNAAATTWSPVWLEVRLVTCGVAYLLDVLPKLPWMDSRQAAFMCRCRLLDRSYWSQLGREAELGQYDTASPWYGKPRPQSIPEEGLSYRWEIGREELLHWHGYTLAAKFRGAGDGAANKVSVAAFGLDWCLYGKMGAGFYLAASVPPQLGLTFGAHVVGYATAQLEVHGAGGTVTSGVKTVVARTTHSWACICDVEAQMLEIGQLAGTDQQQLLLLLLLHSLSGAAHSQRYAP